MIAYKRKVTNIYLYDINKLKADMGADRAHKGNGQIVFEFDRDTLSDKERIHIKAVMDNYLPINNEYYGRQVRCAEDIDRITGERIRRLLVSGGDPIQAQLKILTEVINEILEALNLETKYNK